MSLRNIGVEFTNGSHALVSITGDWIAHLLDLVEIPIASTVIFTIIHG